MIKNHYQKIKKKFDNTVNSAKKYLRLKFPNLAYFLSQSEKKIA